MPEPSNSLSPQWLMDTVIGFQRSRVILTGFELGVFTALNDEWKTAGELAEALESDPRATDRLLNALTAMGLLEKREGRYMNGPLAARFLVRGKPDYLAGLGHSANLWNTWSGLTEAVRTGRPAPRPPIAGRESDWVRPFIAAMHGRGRQQAPDMIGRLDLNGVSRVLDVGGGSGAYSMAFVRARSGITATVFDLPNVIPLTRTYVESEGFSGKIEAVAGNYLSNDLPGGFDLVFLSAIVHSNSPEENQLLVRKAAGAVRPGGQVVVADFLVNEDRSGPLQPTLFALNMLVGTEQGDTFTESEIRSWMEAAGLRDIVRIDTASPASMVVGLK